MMDRTVLSFSCKAVGDPAARTFEGYGSVFGGIDSYNDTIEKGAYRKTLRAWKAQGRLPKLLLQHGGGWLGGADDLVPIGKWEEMREDDTGLFVKGRLFDVQTPRVIETYAAMQEGELDGLSIGYRPVEYVINDKTGIRTLTEIDLREVSIVTFPADDAARIGSVKYDGALPSEREFERWLRREAGVTEAQAKGIIARGYRQVRREAMSPEGQSFADLLALVESRQHLHSY